MKLLDFFKNNAALAKKVDENEIWEQEQNVQDVIDTLQKALVSRFPNLKNQSIQSDVKLDVLTQGDIINTSHALQDAHERLRVKMEYLPLDEYEVFETVRDVIVYFVQRYDYRVNIENQKTE